MNLKGVGKQRLDQLLLARALAPTREKAQALILAGQVLVNDTPAEKAGEKFPEDVEIRLRGSPSRYVGRGGDKLEGALKHFKIPVEGRVLLDTGASTGGFTDCMLQHGVLRSYAVDVGYNQLDERLRKDERVVVLERTHAKDLRPEMFSPPPDLGTVDVSFISVCTVMDFILPVFAAPADLIVLVKPQFEVGRELVGKGGVVKEERLQLESVEKVRRHGEALGLVFHGSVPSELKGGKKGNQEYFIHFCLGTCPRKT